VKSQREGEGERYRYSIKQTVARVFQNQTNTCQKYKIYIVILGYVCDWYKNEFGNLDML
jgi:hypothetical protein